MCLTGALAASVAACSPYGGGAFSCSDSAQCGPDGVCEPNMLCSFPAADCASGRSYGEASGSLAGVCVGEEPVDAALVVDGPPGSIDGAGDAPVTAGFCDPGDPTLRLCLPFEGNATDGSSTATPVITSSITFATGQVGMAVAVTGTSRIDIAETPALDIAHMTVEAWINVQPLPASGRSGVMDNNGQWGLFVLTGGDLRCTPATGITASSVIQAGQWTHVACTYDGTTELLYVDGTVVGTVTSAGTLPTAGVDGASIAGDNPPGPDRLLGMVDQLRVFSEARTPAQICAAAGRTSCP